MKAPSTVFYTRFQTAVLTSQPPWSLVFRSPSQRSQGSKFHLKTALTVDNSSSMEPEAPFLGFLLIGTNSLLHRWREKCNLFPAQHLKQLYIGNLVPLMTLSQTKLLGFFLWLFLLCSFHGLNTSGHFVGHKVLQTCHSPCWNEVPRTEQCSLFCLLSLTWNSTALSLPLSLLLPSAAFIITCGSKSRIGLGAHLSTSVFWMLDSPFTLSFSESWFYQSKY